jgi:hypothetical protein
MFSTHLIWFRRLLVLTAVVAGVTASAAAASAVRASAVPDVLERYAAAHPYGSVAVPDVLERYAATHPYGADTLSTALGTARIVDDWFRDPTPASNRLVDDSFRDPTPIATPAGDRIVDDSFRDSAPAVVSTTSGNGLDWGDFGIGAGAMLGLTLLVTGLGLGTVAMRHRASKLGTS